MATSDYMLTPQELLYRQRKRRWLIIIAAGLSLLLIVGFFVARPARNAIRGWQARRHADRALVFIDQEKWREARDEATAAYQLQSTEPRAIRAVARLLSRAGQPTEALEFWKNLATVAPLTPEDLREQAGIALKANDLATATQAVERLLKNEKQKPTTADLLLAADICARKRDFLKAGQFAEKALAEPQPTPREQLRAVLILRAVMQNGFPPATTKPKDIDDRLVSLVMGNDDAALDALVALAQSVLETPAGTNTSPPLPVDQLVRKIDNHPLAKVTHKLLAADLEILQDPTRQKEIEEREIDRWKNSGNEELAALVTWLYRHGEYQRALDTVPLERAVQTRELFLQYVDTLGALGRWDDIRKILESERYPLDPVIQSMYLARCYTQQGQQRSADNNWQTAIQRAAGDMNHLLMLAEYAEKNGALTVAGTAYDAAINVSPRSRPAQLGRLRLAQASGDTKRIHTVLEDLLKLWPIDTALQNDEAYTRLLLLPPETKPDANELKSIEPIAQKLVQQEPTSLPHRTLFALVYLKENRPYDALALYAGINVPSKELSPAAVAVHAAVLLATDHKEDAQTEISHVPLQKLLPEERALIKE